MLPPTGTRQPRRRKFTPHAPGGPGARQAWPSPPGARGSVLATRGRARQGGQTSWATATLRHTRVGRPSALFASEAPSAGIPQAELMTAECGPRKAARKGTAMSAEPSQPSLRRHHLFCKALFFNHCSAKGTCTRCRRDSPCSAVVEAVDRQPNKDRKLNFSQASGDRSEMHIKIEPPGGDRIPLQRRRPSAASTKGGGLRPPPFVDSFALALNKAHVLALNTAHVLRLNKADVLALNKAHVLHLINPDPPKALPGPP